MLKKVFSVVLCLVLACSMLSAFAITAEDITTTTTYLSENEITVRTTVINATSGNTYTYLAHNNEKEPDDLINTDIVYVDEKKADGTTVYFDYTTSNSKIGSSVRVSGVAGDTLPELAPEYTHKVSVDGAEAVDGTIEGLADADADAYVLVAVAGLTEKKVVAVTVDGEAVEFLTAANGVRIKAGALKGKEEAPVVAITTEAYSYVSVRTEGLGIIAEDNKDSAGAAAVIACAQVLGAVDEFGIEFSLDKDFAADVLKAAALGKGTDGRFAVKLAKYLVHFEDAEAPVYARAYYVLGGNTVYGPTWVTPKPVEEVVAE